MVKYFVDMPDSGIMEVEAEVVPRRGERYVCMGVNCYVQEVRHDTTQEESKLVAKTTVKLG